MALPCLCRNNFRHVSATRRHYGNEIVGSEKQKSRFGKVTTHLLVKNKALKLLASEWAVSSLPSEQEAKWKKNECRMRQAFYWLCLIWPSQQPCEADKCSHCIVEGTDSDLWFAQHHSQYVAIFGSELRSACQLRMPLAVEHTAAPSTSSGTCWRCMKPESFILNQAKTKWASVWKASEC